MSNPLRLSVPELHVLPVRRVLPYAQASALVGETVAAEPGPPTVPRVTPDRLVFLVDEADGQPVAIVTVLPRTRIAALRRAVLGLEMATVARMSSRMAGQGRTFGWAPRRVVNGRESCRATSANRDFPGSYAVLDELANHLTQQFGDLMPGRARADADVLAAE